MKTAILQVADTGPLESLVVMLRHAGYECFITGEALRATLRGWGLDTVLDVASLVRGWGYDQPFELPFAGPEMLNRCDLYVDVKAHRNGPLLWEHVPRLKDRTLWYRINGGKPEHVVKSDTCCTCGGLGRIRALAVVGEKDTCLACGGAGKVNIVDHGDEVNPPCPVLTPNQWYRESTYQEPRGAVHEIVTPAPWAYTCWPIFCRFGEYYAVHGRP